MSSEKEQVEELEPTLAEDSSAELEDSDLEEVAGGVEDAETISHEGKFRYGK